MIRVILNPTLNPLRLVIRSRVGGVHLVHEILQPLLIVGSDQLILKEEASHHIAINRVAQDFLVDFLTVVVEEFLFRQTGKVIFTSLERGVDVVVIADGRGGAVRVADGLAVRAPFLVGIKPRLVHCHGQGDGVAEARVMGADFGQVRPAATEHVAAVVAETLINHDLVQVHHLVNVGDEFLLGNVVHVNDLFGSRSRTDSVGAHGASGCATESQGNQDDADGKDGARDATAIGANEHDDAGDGADYECDC